jgi:hypothetical protein
VVGRERVQTQLGVRRESGGVKAHTPRWVWTRPRPAWSVGLDASRTNFELGVDASRLLIIIKIKIIITQLILFLILILLIIIKIIIRITKIILFLILIRLIIIKIIIRITKIILFLILIRLIK